MTAVANPPSFQHINRAAWGANGGQGGLNSLNHDEVARMFMPRKSAQRANSSSSISSASSNTSNNTIIQPVAQTNGTLMPAASDPGGWNAAAGRKKPQRGSAWPSNKSEPISGISSARPQTVLATNGTSAVSSISSVQQQSAVVPSQNTVQSSSQQLNGARQGAPVANEGNPVLYLLSMNGTFERKTITVPYYPENLRIGRQTNAKTVPTPSNGFFDSKVLSRQHAEIWADRNGKVWIRDVRSSNGTFVNGARLSAENRDSDPHELQSQDHLELGIDIVSEDQKTVVHHKVAAKVEHAGFLGTSNDPLAMSFGDLDPANAAMMLPSQSLQNGLQMRGRGANQGSVGNSTRFGPPVSLVATHISAGQQRPMNFWLTPVTTEQIVKRLTHEMRTARSQTNDLGRTEQFFSTLLSKDDFREPEKSNSNEPVKQPQINGSSIPFKVDGKPRFSDPPAPPPQQPLPEKPDVGRPHMFELGTPSLKRSTTERPRSVPNVPHERPEPTGQIVSLVEALATAKKEIDAQNARMRDLEDMLLKEREARENAEKLAKTLELESLRSNARMNGFVKGGLKSSVLGEASEPSKENLKPNKESDTGVVLAASMIADSVEASTAKLQERLEKMMLEMKEMKDHMESYRRRAESAEADRDLDRKSLAEMVEKIRSEEQTRRSSSTERARSPCADLRSAVGPEASASGNKYSDLRLPLSGEARNADSTGEAPLADNPLMLPLSQPPGSQSQFLDQSAPYASMLGIVLIGMGLMAYMNGWQKIER